MTPMRANIVGPFCFDDQKQGLDRILPFLDLLFGLRQLLDISGGILEGDELAALGQRHWIVETPLPSFVRLQ
jgi:hypothetical protein